jgi:nitrate/nitrite transport system permease protein
MGGIWHLISIITENQLPTPLATLTVLWEMLRDPFYDYGPNDKGIALQLFSSLGRVFLGFTLGSLKDLLSNCTDFKAGFSPCLVSYRTCHF